MANNKVKIAVFGTVVVVAVVLIVGLVVHRSLYRDRLCKNSDLLYYEDPNTNTGTCLPEGMRGPCGKNMVLSLDHRNGSKGVGTCACDTEHFARTMIYHEETNQCYFIFTQAYCEDGQWLTINKGQGPICDTRICEEPEEGTERVPLRDGRCVHLERYDNITCNESQVIQFYRRRIYPSCKPGLGTSIGSVGSVPSTDCPDGYFSTGVGHCQPDFDFD